MQHSVVDESPASSRKSAGWSLWTVSVTLLMVAIAVDHFEFFNGNAGKLIVTAMALGILAYYLIVYRIQFNPPAWASLLWMLLMLYSTPGVLYMKLVPNAPKTLFSATTMGILIVSVQFLPKRLLNIDPDAAMKVLKWIGLLFLMSSILAFAIFKFVGFIPLLVPRVHERTYFLSLPLSIAFLNRRPLSLLLTLALLAVLLVLNPRTTILLTYMMSGSLLAYFTMNRTVKMLLLPLIFTSSILIMGNAYELALWINATFKSSAGASDNASMRTDILPIAMPEFYASPVVGSLFTRGGAYDYGVRMSTELSGQAIESTLIPLHDDYLEFLISGGVIGGVLFVASFLGFLMMGFSNANKCLRLGEMKEARYNQVLTIALISAMACMCFNPVLNNPQNGVGVYAIIALIVMENLYLRDINIAQPGNEGNPPGRMTFMTRFRPGAPFA